MDCHNCHDCLYKKAFLKACAFGYELAKAEPKVYEFLAEMVHHLGFKICYNEDECDKKSDT